MHFYGMYQRRLKRLFDLSIALPVLLLSLPLQLFLLLLGALIFRMKPIFRQKRIGLFEEPFTLWKFRTMREAFDSSGNALDDKERLNLYGRILRKSSLDELPQLFLVLSGRMSMVGPRPLLPEYLELYTEAQRRRHNVKPGITGWVQVNGRNDMSWKDKFALDLWYVDHCSFLLDLRIMLRTLSKVIQSKGVNARGEATAPFFNGKN